MVLNSHLYIRLSSEAVTLLILGPLHLKIFCFHLSATTAKDIIKHLRTLVTSVKGTICVRSGLVVKNDDVNEY